MNTHALALTALVAVTALSSTVTTGTQFTGSTTEQLHALACSQPAKSDNPWNIKNLYDCRTSTLYIPHQLWTGAKWDGAKGRECNRAASARAVVMPARAAKPWTPERTPGKGAAALDCHDKGFGEATAAGAKRCQFPAGHGWALSVRRDCADTAIEITAIKLNSRNELESIEFNWWDGNALKSRYRYAQDQGMTSSWGY